MALSTGDGLGLNLSALKSPAITKREDGLAVRVVSIKSWTVETSPTENPRECLGMYTLIKIIGLDSWPESLIAVTHEHGAGIRVTTWPLIALFLIKIETPPDGRPPVEVAGVENLLKFGGQKPDSSAEDSSNVSCSRTTSWAQRRSRTNERIILQFP